MLPRRFELHRPDSLPALFDLLGRHGDDAAVMAGGTELLVALKARVLQYGHLIDIKRLPGLDAIAVETDGALRIGALATHDRIAHDAQVRARLPAFARLSGNVANIRVRCAGTLGGNLCFAEPHADPPAMLAALGASLELVSPGGTRLCPMADFIQGPFETARQPDEILAAVRVPAMAPGSRAAYRAFGHLHRPAVGAAAVLELDEAGRVCRSVRLWLGAIAGRPVCLEALAASLAGAPVAALDRLLAGSVEAAVSGLEADDDLHGGADYKRHLAGTMLRRAVQACIAGDTERRAA